ncbi:MAG: Ornithine decarboxylase [candidate division WS6 bacterium 34_10]|uniref:Ornithine decarboxylase n=1 Tax=candidate division WS6 bacterium 34_10 TaxID=1641389 RepID=A0A101HIW2_9BACT|nr:MAG: Ornithine decarboxylase [candidate division WS6 bacterium 34_10]
MKLPKTPIYQYKQKTCDRNIKEFNTFLKNKIDVYYAIKANNYEPLVKSMIEANYGFDVASIEEIEYVLSLGADPSKISFSAPTKLVRDIKQAAKYGIKQFAFDSIIEIDKIMKNVKDPILIARITANNSDAAFNLSVKFGITPEHYPEILEKVYKDKIPLKGVTFHVGSQNTSVTSWRSALRGAQDFINLAQEYGINISLLNIGGGIPVQYNGYVRHSKYYINKILQYIERFRERNRNIEKIIIEPGRALSANTTDLLVKVVNIKEYKNPPLLITDLSVFNGLIEPLEGFEYDIEALDDHKPRQKLKYYKVAGLSCDGCDIIKKKCLLPKSIKVGDYLRIKQAGAYTFVYKNFHMREFPKIVNIK